MKTENKTNTESILEYMEAVSAEIQLLALNIAVAAAKLAHKNNIGIEVNQNLSNLVNQATRAVKQMNQIIDAARAEKGTRRILADSKDEPIDLELIGNVESVMGDIIRDSEKIIRLLVNVKKR